YFLTEVATLNGSQSNDTVTRLPSFKATYVGTAPPFSCRKLLEDKNMRQTSYLLKSAVYVLLATVCVIPFALAQQNSSNSSLAPGRWPLPSLSDLAGGGRAMRPVSHTPTRASVPLGVTTPTPTP